MVPDDFCSYLSSPVLSVSEDHAFSLKGVKDKSWTWKSGKGTGSRLWLTGAKEAVRWAGRRHRDLKVGGVQEGQGTRSYWEYSLGKKAGYVTRSLYWVMSMGTCEFGGRRGLRRVWVRPGCGTWNKDLGIEENGKEAWERETRPEYMRA